MLQQILGGGLDFAGLIILFMSYMAIVLVTMPVHECAHAFVATKLGDPTPRWHGRLSLNPMAHIDVFGTVMLLLFGFGFAKPVPVNATYFKNPRTGMALTALAGPVSNLLVATLAVGLCRVLFWLPVASLLIGWLIQFLQIIAIVNISLAVFNLLPIPPLDGFRIISPLLPAKWVYLFDRYQQYITFGLLALLAIGALDTPLMVLRGWLTNLIFGLFGF